MLALLLVSIHLIGLSHTTKIGTSESQKGFEVKTYMQCESKIEANIFMGLAVPLLEVDFSSLNAR